MFKNYWIIAVRSLQRNRSYTIINFMGLTVGMAACLLLFLLVRYETSFDTFHTKKDRIYRVITVNRGPQGEGRQSGVPYALAGALKSAGYAQLEQVAPSYMAGGMRTWDSPKKPLLPSTSLQIVSAGAGRPRCGRICCVIPVWKVSAIAIRPRRIIRHGITISGTTIDRPRRVFLPACVSRIPAISGSITCPW
jgi:hypothetical protein